MAYTKNQRNPGWTRDELILVLDFYLRHYPQIPDKKSEEVSNLSRELHKLGEHLFPEKGNTFRNPNGVYMKMMNFHAVNPDHGGKGLKAGAKLDREVWEKFAGNSDALALAANTIRKTLVAGALTIQDSIDDAFEEEAEEGRVLTKRHKRYERNKKLVERKKKSVLAALGKLECEGCGFNFQERYGSRGEDFIECHHKLPVSSLTPGQKTKLSDLALLCSNCHRMVHRRRPWLSIDQLKSIIKTG